MRAMRVVGRLVFLVWAALCVFGARAYSQTGLGETLSGPDSHERRQGADGYLLGDWGGERTRLLERGVRFDFQYIRSCVGFNNC
jgi:carbohydrate-selective porin OprB